MRRIMLVYFPFVVDGGWSNSGAVLPAASQAACHASNHVVVQSFRGLVLAGPKSNGLGFVAAAGQPARHPSDHSGFTLLSDSMGLV